MNNEPRHRLTCCLLAGAASYVSLLRRRKVTGLMLGASSGFRLGRRCCGVVLAAPLALLALSCTDSRKASLLDHFPSWWTWDTTGFMRPSLVFLSWSGRPGESWPRRYLRSSRGSTSCRLTASEQHTVARLRKGLENWQHMIEQSVILTAGKEPGELDAETRDARGGERLRTFAVFDDGSFAELPVEIMEEPPFPLVVESPALGDNRVAVPSLDSYETFCQTRS